MSGRAGPRRAVVELARIRAHVYSQLLERSRGHVRPEHVRRHGIDGRRPEQQGIAVRRGAYDFSRAYGAVGPRLALHDETLAEARFDPRGYRPEDGFRNAPCGEWDDHANGFAGPVLGEAGRRPERKQPGGEECQNVSHERILYWEDRCPATSSAFCSYARGTFAARPRPRRFSESWPLAQGSR